MLEGIRPQFPSEITHLDDYSYFGGKHPLGFFVCSSGTFLNFFGFQYQYQISGIFNLVKLDLCRICLSDGLCFTSAMFPDLYI